MNNPYKILGLDPSATATEIRRAYKKLAGKHHPDRGGDKAKFQEVKESYETLSNPEYRAQYDATGKVEKQDLKQTALATLIQKISAKLDENRPFDTFNLFRMTENELKDSKAQITTNIGNGELFVKKLSNLSKRMTKKGDGENIFVSLVEDKITNVEAQLTQMRFQLEVGDEMLLMLSDYDYEELMQLGGTTSPYIYTTVTIGTGS